MASFVYNVAKTKFANGLLDWDTNTFKAMLIATSYTADPDHATVSALTELANGTGYTGGFAGSGRKTLATNSVVQVDASDRAELRVSVASVWSAINAGTAKAAVIIREMTTDADSVPVAYIDSGGFPVTTNGGDLTITWNAAGAIQFT
jgi:hypothetical protein